MEIPVYLFTGFLDGGKTTFMQKTLEDERFNQGESTLLLLCEAGEEAYDPASFAAPRVFVERLREESELTGEQLSRLCAKHACERVFVEYNGMWRLDRLYEALPEGWMVYQEFLFVDGGSFLSYHSNLRELMIDKLKSCEMLVINRIPEGLDRALVHKIVRAVNRRCDIAYEAENGTVSYDERPEELPFDLNAPVLKINLEDYAIWYRNVSEHMDQYEGKTIELEGYVVHKESLPDNAFIFGRQIMTCCADDLTFAGVLAIWKNAKSLTHQEWIKLTAKIALRQTKVYGRRGPVLQILSVATLAEPEKVVASFY